MRPGLGRADPQPTSDGIAVYLAAPLRRRESLVGALVVEQASPRAWTGGEIALTEAVAERAWAAAERVRAQGRLRDSDAQARARADEMVAIYDGAPIGLCVLDREGRYVRINDVPADGNGLPAEAHTGRPMREILPGLADGVEPLLARALAGEALRGREITGTTPARPNLLRVWRESFVALRDAGGASSA